MLFLLSATLALLGVVQAQNESLLLPYGEEYGDLIMPRRTNSFVQYSLKEPDFPFFKDKYKTIYISSNGALSFRTGLVASFNECSPIGKKDNAMVIPYWSNVYLAHRSIGQVYYRQSFNTSDLERVASMIKKPYTTFWDWELSWVFVTTWHRVGTTIGFSKENTFQAILATDGSTSWTIFNYQKLEWVCHGLDIKCKDLKTEAGLGAGDGRTLYKLRGSGTDGIRNLQRESNIGHPGRWVFKVDKYFEDMEEANVCNYDKELEVIPNFVSAGGLVELRGPCIKNSTEVTNIEVLDAKNTSLRFSKFEDIDVHILRTEEAQLFIILPETLPRSAGRLILTLNITQDNGTSHGYEAYIYTTRYIPRVELQYNSGNTTAVSIKAEWDKSIFRAKEVDIILILYARSNNRSMESVSRIDNSGSILLNISKEGLRTGIPQDFEVEDLIVDVLPHGIIAHRSPSGSKTNTRPGRIRRQLSWKGVRTIVIDSFFEVWKRTLSGSIVRNTGSYLTCSFIIRGPYDLFTNWGKAIIRNATERCNDFYQTDPGLPLDTPGLEPCPPTMGLIENDDRFEFDSSRWYIAHENFLHPGMFKSYRQKHKPNGLGNQCVYDRNGNIITTGRGKGTVDAASGFWDHLAKDVWPYCDCCEYSNNCEKYDEKRPSDNGTNYKGPRSTQTVGDPHMTTFDGLQYTFNGAGEFWMVKSNSSKFQMQGRFQPVGTATATAASAYVMINGNTTVQIDGSCEILLDGIRMHFPKKQGTQLLAKGGVIITRKNACFQVSFMYGKISFTFFHVGWGFLNFVGQSSVTETVDFRGLMGTLNGSVKDDLTCRNGTVIPRNSSLEQIHYNFGLSWLVYENETFFAYRKGKSYSTYYNPGFRPIFEIQWDNVTTQAREVCGNSTECLFDFAATGDMDFANSTGILTQRFQQVNKELEKYRLITKNSTDISDPVTTQKPATTQNTTTTVKPATTPDPNKRMDFVPIKLHISIRNLPKNDYGLMSEWLWPDPYLKVHVKPVSVYVKYRSLSWNSVGNFYLIEHTARYIDRTDASWTIWNVIPYFPNESEGKQIINIEVWDEDIQHDDKMDEIHIDLDTLLKPDKDGKVKDYTPQDPATLEYKRCCSWHVITVKGWVVKGHEFVEF